MATFEFLENESLDNSYSSSIDFNSLMYQYAFWTARVKTVTELPITTSRLLAEGQPIKIGLSMQALFGINYCRVWQDNRYWYFFIVSKTFINEYNTSIVLELDVLQTFMFNVIMEESFIAREHQDRFDVLYNRKYNTQNEPVTYGKNYKLEGTKTIYPCNGYDNYFNLFKPYFLAITATPDYFHVTTPRLKLSPLETLIFPIMPMNADLEITNLKIQVGNATPVRCATITEIMEAFNGNDSIYSMTVVPYTQISSVSVTGDSLILKLPNSATIATLSIIQGQTVGAIVPNIKTNYEWALSKFDNPSKFSGQLAITDSPNIEAESKLFTDPYYFFQITDNNNAPKNFLNEHCPDELQIRHFASYDGIIKDKTGIEDYGLNTENIEEHEFSRVNQLELPLTSDAWLNYFRNNKASIQTGVLSTIAGGITTVGTAVAMENYIGAGVAAGSTITSIIQQIAKISDIKKAPDSIRSVGNTGQYYISADEVYFKFRVYKITDEYRNILFKYFQRYGYACNEFKVPNLRSRYYYNYIKAISPNFKTDIDNEYIQRISKIFENGITFWHYRDDAHWLGVNDYSKENLEMVLV